MSSLPRVPPKVVMPLKQFGSQWIERVEVIDSLDAPVASLGNGVSTPVTDPSSYPRHQYDFIYREHITVDGKHELRLERIRPYPVSSST